MRPGFFSMLLSPCVNTEDPDKFTPIGARGTLSMVIWLNVLVCGSEHAEMYLGGAKTKFQPWFLIFYGILWVFTIRFPMRSKIIFYVGILTALKGVLYVCLCTWMIYHMEKSFSYKSMWEIFKFILAAALSYFEAYFGMFMQIFGGDKVEPFEEYAKAIQEEAKEKEEERGRTMNRGGQTRNSTPVPRAASDEANEAKKEDEAEKALEEEIASEKKRLMAQLRLSEEQAEARARRSVELRGKMAKYRVQ
eukprot:gnl/MRDRNA2_/MRDRNA2_106057_c0_seq1.p1 gnl/MRDRNA2_/MRDRNA2_106057_c0~~gnl/MRDRNA2_/MRDRNA2_106057_c0_seq1.p1  ORF type:complete len:249 (+),score=53.32 gnl/MRDRNA2_/MRDRNA2_106057_c0_seq1:95-841(+)